MSLLKDEERVELSKYSASWNTVLGQIVGNDVTSQVDALMYVVLSRAEKHMLMGS